MPNRPQARAVSPTAIIAHERIGAWTGRLRPRFAADPAVRWVESRSAADLAAAAAGDAVPIVLIDLASRPHWGLEGLDALHRAAPDALALVLDPGRVPEVPALARELGATLVWTGVVVPPRVESLFRRWLILVDRRRPPRPARTHPTPVPPGPKEA